MFFFLQENVPFFHTLAKLVVANQGYGMESLSTLFFLFGASSVLVGVLFYLLGHFDLGRVVYFFPNHVLVGCIGGIGECVQLPYYYCTCPFNGFKMSTAKQTLILALIITLICDRSLHCCFSLGSHQ